ncbi:MAG: hypothetical protein AAFY20_12580 [Cyanobacteria bacterium J06639_14]
MQVLKNQNPRRTIRQQCSTPTVTGRLKPQTHKKAIDLPPAIRHQLGCKSREPESEATYFQATNNLKQVIFSAYRIRPVKFEDRQGNPRILLNQIPFIPLSFNACIKAMQILHSPLEAAPLCNLSIKTERFSHRKILFLYHLMQIDTG